MQDKKPKIVGWGKLENQDGYSADNSLDKHNDRHTGTTFAEQRPPLGVGELVSETSAIVFSHWFVVILLGFVPSFIGQVLSGFLAGAKLSFGTQTFLYPGLGGDFASLLAGLISIVSFAITLALLVQFAYDAKLFRRFEFKRYIVTAFATLLPNAVLITIVVLAILGTAFFGFAFMEGPARAYSGRSCPCSAGGIVAGLLGVFGYGTGGRHIANRISRLAIQLGSHQKLQVANRRSHRAYDCLHSHPFHDCGIVCRIVRLGRAGLSALFCRCSLSRRCLPWRPDCSVS